MYSINEKSISTLKIQFWNEYPFIHAVVAPSMRKTIAKHLNITGAKIYSNKAKQSKPKEVVLANLSSD